MSCVDWQPHQESVRLNSSLRLILEDGRTNGDLLGARSSSGLNRADTTRRQNGVVHLPVRMWCMWRTRSNRQANQPATHAETVQSPYHAGFSAGMAPQQAGMEVRKGCLATHRLAVQGAQALGGILDEAHLWPCFQHDSAGPSRHPALSTQQAMFVSCNGAGTHKTLQTWWEGKRACSARTSPLKKGSIMSWTSGSCTGGTTLFL